MTLTPTTNLYVMHLTVSLLFSAGCTGASSAGGSADRVEKSANQDGLLLVVSAPAVVGAGQAVWLRITLLNQGHELVRLLHPRRCKAFDIQVSRITRTGTHPASRTALGRRVLDQGARVNESVSTEEILRDYGMRYEVNVAGLFDMSQPGRYAFSVSPAEVAYPKGIVGPSVTGLELRTEALSRDTQVVDADGKVVEDVLGYFKLVRDKSAEIRRKSEASQKQRK